MILSNALFHLKMWHNIVTKETGQEWGWGEPSPGKSVLSAVMSSVVAPKGFAWPTAWPGSDFGASY